MLILQTPASHKEAGVYLAPATDSMAPMRIQKSERLNTTLRRGFHLTGKEK